jgi:hypothetical protein
MQHVTKSTVATQKQTPDFDINGSGPLSQQSAPPRSQQQPDSKHTWLACCKLLGCCCGAMPFIDKIK